jgi:hypothetical protein
LEKEVTDIKIDSSEGLEVFLKILAEESVASSRLQISEGISDEKEYQKEFVKKIVKDKQRFDEAEEPSSEDNSKEEINYYTIRKIINQIRAGDSTKDSDVAEPLEQYIMSDLDDEERELMYTFLLSVANIMNKTGQPPQDPSDPPVSLDVSKEKTASSSKASKRPEDAEGERSQPQKSSGPEDTTPPIQVGSQVKESIRQRVRELMKG